MLPEVTVAAAARHGEATAFRSHEGWDVSFTDLDRLSDEAAAWLTMLGVGQGSVLGLCMPGRIDFIVAYLAAAKVGAITAGIGPGLGAAERAASLEALAPDLVLASEDQLDGLPPHLDIELIRLAHAAEEVLAAERVIGEMPPALAPDPDRPVCICFTSGRAGEPVGAWFSNRQLAAFARLGPDRGLASGGHGYAAALDVARAGFMTSLPSLLSQGVTTHLLDQWRADLVLHLIDQHQIPVVSATAQQVALMVELDDLDQLDFGSVETVITGAVPPAVAKAGRELFGARWLVLHSSTESGGLGLCADLDGDHEGAYDTIGRPEPGVEAEIRDANGEPLAAGEVGELWLRTPAQMSGYWNNPKATARVLVGGWIRTHELAVVDLEGCHRLVVDARGGQNGQPSGSLVAAPAAPGPGPVAD